MIFIGSGVPVSSRTSWLHLRWESAPVRTRNSSLNYVMSAPSPVSSSCLQLGMGSGALSGPALCAQYNYDTIHSTDLSLSLNVVRNAGPDNASG